MAKLQCNQPRFEKAHRREYQHAGDRNKNGGMHPPGRAEFDFNIARQSHTDKSYDNKRKKNRAIAGVLRSEVQPTGLAFFCKCKEPAKKPSLSTAWAAAFKCNLQWGRAILHIPLCCRMRGGGVHDEAPQKQAEGEVFPPHLHYQCPPHQ